MLVETATLTAEILENAAERAQGAELVMMQP